MTPLSLAAGSSVCAIAYEMAGSGKSVACIEKNAASGAGSTCNSCAIIRTHYSTLNGAALAKSNYPYWEDWAGYLHGKRGRDSCKIPGSRMSLYLFRAQIITD